MDDPRDVRIRMDLDLGHGRFGEKRLAVVTLDEQGQIGIRRRLGTRPTCRAHCVILRILSGSLERP